MRRTAAGQALHNFAAGEGGPPAGELTAGRDGNIYGTTATGGEFGSGTLFRLTAPSTVDTIFSFPADQPDPRGGVILGSDGRLYGTTGGGTPGFGLVFRIDIDGTIKMSKDGAVFQTLAQMRKRIHHMYAFGPGSDAGFSPSGRLLLGSDAMLYGTTLIHSEPSAGCVNFGCGAVYRFNLAGAIPFAIQCSRNSTAHGRREA